MSTRTPAGFCLAGLCSALFALWMAGSVVAPVEAGGWTGVLRRGACALLVALAVVATEALWRARPWAWRASLALALTFGTAVLLAYGLDPNGGLVNGLVVVFFCSLVLLPLLAYIRHRSQQLWPRPGGPARVHLPAASPYPPAHVAVPGSTAHRPATWW